MKKGTAGVMWTEDELKIKEDALNNTKKYDADQRSIVKRFFATIHDYGGEYLKSLTDIIFDELGCNTR